MKKLFILSLKLLLNVSFFLLLPFFSRHSLCNQNGAVCTGRWILKRMNDTIRMYALRKLGSYYDDVTPDSYVPYLEKANNIQSMII